MTKRKDASARAAHAADDAGAGKVGEAARDQASQRDQSDRAERELARLVAMGLPLVVVTATVIVWFVWSIASALLVLAGGTLIGTIALFWASLRTLSGDAPLPEDLEDLADRERGATELQEKKRTVLRALKDLDHEYSVGKLGKDDYEDLSATYRAEAKEILRELDHEMGPLRVEAEKIVAGYLKKQDLELVEAIGKAPEVDAPFLVPAGTAKASDDGPFTKTEPTEIEPAKTEPGKADASLSEASEAAPERSAATGRVKCEACATMNEPDAAFCKSCGQSMKRVASDAAP